MLVKDNHRPIIPKPIDGKLVFPPKTGNIKCEKTTPVCSNPTEPTMVDCKKYSYYSK